MRLAVCAVPSVAALAIVDVGQRGAAGAGAGAGTDANAETAAAPAESPAGVEADVGAAGVVSGMAERVGPLRGRKHQREPHDEAPAAIAGLDRKPADSVVAGPVLLTVRGVGSRDDSSGMDPPVSRLCASATRAAELQQTVRSLRQGDRRGGCEATRPIFTSQRCVCSSFLSLLLRACVLLGA